MYYLNLFNLLRK